MALKYITIMLYLEFGSVLARSLEEDCLIWYQKVIICMYWFREAFGVWHQHDFTVYYKSI